MSRSTGLAVGVAMLVLGGAVFAASMWMWPTSMRGSTSAPAAGVAAGSLDDALLDLQLIPLDGQSPKPFALETLDGRRVALADLAGRPALLYFWATW
jgi:hypothetical protein